MYELIAAIESSSSGIGKDGSLPWGHHKEDMDFFRRKTAGSIIIMGRGTWNSLPPANRPLKGRYTIVVSSTLVDPELNDESGEIVSSFELMLKRVDSIKTKKGCIHHPYSDASVFVVGGASLYTQFLSKALVDRVWLTHIDSQYECDTFFPYSFLSDFIRKDIVKRSGNSLWVEYEYQNKEEQRYLTHLSNIIELGEFRENRTETPTYSIFCPPQLRFDLSENRFPLLTTKRCVLRQIFVELQFYLSGRSDSKELEANKVFVWKGNTTRDFLDKRGLTHYKEGDMGPSYSFNFRHLGAEYTGCEESYTGKGFDQLQYCIDLIRTNPTSRRIIIDLWDPPKLDQMSLPPCMFLYQFYVSKDKKLHCHATLRSSDTLLGLPWNIATASLLTIMMAKTCDLDPGSLTVTTNDAHVYDNQLDGIKTQLSRTPTTFPKLFVETDETDVTKIKWSDLCLVNYNPQSGIKVPMVV